MPTPPMGCVAGLRTLSGSAALFFLLVLLCCSQFQFFCFPSLRDAAEGEAHISLLADPQIEGDYRVLSQGIYGHLNNVLNDWYSRMIVENVLRYQLPTQLVVLGDLFSSQSVGDTEFERRAVRYEWAFAQHDVPLISLVGNHDIGYSAGITRRQVQRFEARFGAVNSKKVLAGHLLVVVNSMNLEASRDSSLRDEAWAHVEACAIEAQHRKLPVIMFTHIPLHKPAGSCPGDEPWIAHDGNDLVVSQNMLSEEVSSRLLLSLTPRYIFTGHDHIGCSYIHPSPGSLTEMESQEHTVRSVMGDFQGNTALFRILRQSDGDYVYEYTTCPLGLSMSMLLYLAIAELLFAALWLALSVCDCYRLARVASQPQSDLASASIVKRD